MGGRWINDDQIRIDDLEIAAPSGFTACCSKQMMASRPNMIKAGSSRKQIEDGKTVVGEYSFHSQKGDDLKNSMTRVGDSSRSIPTVCSKTWRTSIFSDFARVLVNGQATPATSPQWMTRIILAPVPAIGGESGGWIDAEFDVSQWVALYIELSFEYITDGGLA
ncbi:immune inhibitor A, partial [Vibrio lentus]|nr:immune inhibitor A [Vibrio lentus]